MTNYEVLKEKIQNKILRLKELNNGCIIEKPHFNIFAQKYIPDTFDVYYILNNNIHNKDGGILCSVEDMDREFILSQCKFGKEPMLNDVLEFIYISKSYKNSPIPHEERMILNFLKKWDLSKPYLKDQSDKLIDYLVTI